MRGAFIVVPDLSPTSTTPDAACGNAAAFSDARGLLDHAASFCGYPA